MSIPYRQLALKVSEQARDLRQAMQQSLVTVKHEGQQYTQENKASVRSELFNKVKGLRQAMDRRGRGYLKEAATLCQAL